MSEAAIRAAIVSVVGGVSGIGQVYGRRRWATKRSQVKALFLDDNDILNVWFVRRTKAPGRHSAQGPSLEDRQHHYEIEGFYALNDEGDSETHFNALVEAVCAAFRSAYQLSGTCEDNSPVSVDEVDYRMFQGVLCHYGRLGMDCLEFVTWT